MKKHFLAACTAVFMWGFVSLPLKQLAEYNPFDILFYRLQLSVGFMLLVTFLFRRKAFYADVVQIRLLGRAAQRGFIWVMLVSTLLITLNWYLFIYTISYVNVRAGALAYLICPILTALAGRFIFGEPFSRWRWIGVGLALGAILVFIKGSASEVIVALVIAATYAYYLVLQKRISSFDKFNILLVQFLCSWVVLLPLHAGREAPLTIVFWANVSIVAIFFTILPMFLTNYALQKIGSATMGMLIYVSPILSFLLAVYYFDEKVLPHQWGAYLVLAVALVVFNLPLSKKTN